MSFERRLSRVFKIWGDRGKKFLGFSLYRDQIWFYDREPWWLDDPAEYPEESEVIPFRIAGEWWRWDPHAGDYMRLYMDRVILRTPIGYLRWHTFHSGDDVFAPHDHPWWFVTVPMRSYVEEVEGRHPEAGDQVEVINLDGKHVRWETMPDFVRTQRIVRAFRPHFRPAKYRHVVQEPDRPFSTLVISGPISNEWGFWPEPDKFVSHKENTNYD